MSEITLYLKTKRLKENKLIEDMAKKLKITPASYSSKENGRTQFKVDELKVVKKYLKIDDSDLIKYFLVKYWHFADYWLI